MIHVAKILRRILITGGIAFLFTLIAAGTSLSAQETYDEGQDDEAIEVFWGEEDEYSDEEYYEDEYYEDEYYEDEYYEDEYYEDEFYEEDSAYEEYPEDEYYDESEFYEEEIADTEEGSEEELAKLAERRGLSISVSGSSPGYVSHSLYPYNSGINIRVAVEFPMLMRLGPIIFRLGIEAGNFAFTEWKPPATGELTGLSFAGTLTFPAGPGQVKIGGGMIGSYPGAIAETTYGFAIRNALEIRAGVRSTTAFSVEDSDKNNLGTASWLDGVITIGISL